MVVRRRTAQDAHAGSGPVREVKGGAPSQPVKAPGHGAKFGVGALKPAEARAIGKPAGRWPGAGCAQRLRRRHAPKQALAHLAQANGPRLPWLHRPGIASKAHRAIRRLGLWQPSERLWPVWAPHGSGGVSRPHAERAVPTQPAAHGPARASPPSCQSPSWFSGWQLAPWPAPALCLAGIWPGSVAHLRPAPQSANGAPWSGRCCRPRRSSDRGG
jgi:hypothetical protein